MHDASNRRIDELHIVLVLEGKGGEVCARSEVRAAGFAVGKGRSLLLLVNGPAFLGADCVGCTMTVVKARLWYGGMGF